LYILQTILSSENLKDIIIRYPFVAPMMKPLVTQMSQHFKNGKYYCVDETSDYGKYVLKTIMEYTEQNPNMVSEFEPTLLTTDWFHRLVDEK
jgi:hypothetical protein